MNFQLGVGDKKVKKYLNIRKKAVPRCMRMFMVEFYRECTVATPVDTGRARWGWNCSISDPSYTIPEEAPEGWIGKSKGGREFYKQDLTRASKEFSIKVISGNDTLYVTNAVPYIKDLNNGKSKQAPARFVELSFDYAFTKLEKYISVRGYALEP